MCAIFGTCRTCSAVAAVRVLAAEVSFGNEVDLSAGTIQLRATSADKKQTKKINNRFRITTEYIHIDG